MKLRFVLPFAAGAAAVVGLLTVLTMGPDLPKADAQGQSSPT